jgi:hypothetical protein
MLKDARDTATALKLPQAARWTIEERAVAALGALNAMTPVGLLPGNSEQQRIGARVTARAAE